MAGARVRVVRTYIAEVGTELCFETMFEKCTIGYFSLSRSIYHVRLPETIELKHATAVVATRGVNIFLLSTAVNWGVSYVWFTAALLMGNYCE